MAQSNLELMRTLDDAWNGQDWDTFEKRHSANTVVFWPGQPEATRGRANHKAESITVAHWVNGEIVEEKLFYDLVGMLKQIGVT